jgi:branched-chain amino acid transport system permease protein
MPRLLALLIFAALTAIAPWIIGEGGISLLFEIFLMLAMAEMWNLLAGYAGLVSMGHQGFVGLGAYCLVFAANATQLSPYWVLPLAPLLCAFVAAVTALFLFRLRDAYFSISTWVVAEIFSVLVFLAPGLGGTTGMTLETTRGVDFDWFERVNFWLAAALAAGAVSGLYLMLKSRFGLALTSVRDNDLAATSIGVDVWRNRFIAYVVSAAGCGLAGAVSFMAAMFVTVTTAFDLNWVVGMIFIVIVGGIGTLEGPILGTAIYFGVRELFTGVLGLSGSWYLIAVGAIAIATVLFAPRGIWPVLRHRFGIAWLSVRRSMPAAASSSTTASMREEAHHG